MKIQILKPNDICFSKKEVDIIDGGNSHFLFDYVEYPEEGGIKVYYQDCKEGKWGFPTPEAIKGVNIIKRALWLIYRCGGLRLWFNREKIGVDFCRLADNAMADSYLKESYLCPFVKEFKKLLMGFFNEHITLIISYVFEYDDSYRYALQDLFTEVNKFDLLEHKTYIKLAGLLEKRDQRGGIKKLMSLFKLMSWLILIPQVKRRMNKALLNVDFERLRFDKSDLYWILWRNDYDFLGADYKTRKEIWDLENADKVPQMYKMNIT